MANTFSLKVIACDRIFFDGRCTQVVLPLHDGEKAIQAHHDTCEYPEEIDIRRAKEAKERAEEQLRQKQSIQEYHRSKASLARAMERLKAGRRDTPIGY